MTSYSEVISHARQAEIVRRLEETLEIIEASKTFVMEQDNLIKLRALNARCEKITTPRPPRGKNRKMLTNRKPLLMCFSKNHHI